MTLRPRLLLATALALLPAAARVPVAIDLPGGRAFPESVSILRDRAYVGSAAGGVLRVDLRTARGSQWIAPGAGGSGAIFGVLADPRNNMLWACSNAGAVRGTDGRRALKGFDLRSGRLRLSLDLPGDKPLCNDIEVDAQGDVYVTDTASTRILRWRRGARALETWLDHPGFVGASGGGPDGIAFGRDGALYVNTFYGGELFRVAVVANRAAGAVTRLTLSRPLQRPDALRPLPDGSFLMAEGGGRIDRVRLHDDHAVIDTLADAIDGPTGVAADRTAAWYVQGRLALLYDPAKRALTPPLPFRLTPIALDGTGGPHGSR